jgi:molybdenum cofactor synthesis domain-containing protein
MRDHSNHRVATRHEAVNALLAAWDFERPVQSVPVAEANGRVAARTVRSLVTLPNARTSNMDAVAVRFADMPTDGSVPDTSAWVRGRDWQFCNTGVAVPEGFDTAVRIEDVEVAADAQTMRLLAAPAEKYAMTSEEGSTLQPGDVLVRAGEVVTPALIAALCMGGHAAVDVVRRPRVVFIPTGNELVDPAPQIPRGKNIESNGAMICAKLQSWGAEATRHAIVPDDPEQIRAVLKESAAGYDVVVINAGSSKGSDDFTCEILEHEGEVLFHEVSQGPGKHCSFSMLDGTPVIGISGPPVGAEFTADFFVKPFVDAFLGRDMSWPPTVQAVMLDDNPMQPRRSSVVKRVAVRRDEYGRFVAQSVYLSERPVLRCCDEANGLVTVDKDSYGWQAGDTVEVELRFPYSLPPLR